MNDSAIIAEGLEKRFGNVEALAGVSFVAFGGQQRGEEPGVGQPFPGGGLGDAGMLVADGRQAEGAAAGHDRGVRRRLGQSGHRGALAPGHRRGGGHRGPPSALASSWS